MRQKILTLVAVLATLVLTGCSKISRIEVRSCSLESVSLAGLRGVQARLLLEVDNPALQFTLEDIRGVVYKNGEEYVRYEADPLTVSAKTCASYPLDCTASLAPSVSLTQLLDLVKDFDIEDFTTDIHAKVKLKSGVAKGFDYKDIPLKDLIDD